jgi:hypothetical protein
MRIAHN